jgi:hypothetical protein
MRLLIVAKVSKNPLFCAKIPALEMKKIMAIVNLTPDSFYPGSRVYAEDGTFDASAFLFQVRSALKNGADILLNTVRTRAISFVQMTLQGILSTIVIFH